MKQINHEQLAKLVYKHYSVKGIDNRKIALLIYGTFGIGKSETIRDTAKKIAVEKGKKFVEWNKLSKEGKDELNANPKEYFCLIDIRLSEFDSSDTKGLPDFKDKDSIVWKVPFWAKFLENPNSDGILFFDEINLATPLVISSCYKIIYDRVINESKINDEWLIIGSGNVDSDRAYTHELASPVRDRGSECELVNPSAEIWSNWAISNEIDSRIIAFVNYKPSNLHNVNFDDGQKFTTERGWARLNSLIKDEKDSDTISLLCGTAIGEGIAREFLAFCKINDRIKIERIIENPDELKEVKEMDIKYFVTTAIAEKFKDRKVSFGKVYDISKTLHYCDNAELVALLWRLCIGYDKKTFRDGFLKLNGEDLKLVEKYGKYFN